MIDPRLTEAWEERLDLLAKAIRLQHMKKDEYATADRLWNQSDEACDARTRSLLIDMSHLHRALGDRILDDETALTREGNMVFANAVRVLCGKKCGIEWLIDGGCRLSTGEEFKTLNGGKP
jgi:hypothetical protein